MEAPLLNLQNIHIYQDKHLILKDVSLQVNAGDLIYLIGKTGTGKSSFLKALYADLPISEGEAQIVGFDLKQIKDKDIPFLRRKLGIVFQDFKLLPDRTVGKNLEFVLKATGWKDENEIQSKIDEVLQKVGMHNQAHKMPHQLSGGEQQRVAIARALLNDPDLILADEPTGNLDPQTSVEVMEVLRNINKQGKAILMATHDYAIILKYPSKTLKIDESTVFEVVQKTV
ncbi:MAG: ATP-binding cassette domain-containing protein [Flavobacteriales bacterium]|nr:ATP-binding cassette domain-containing protein [Flavobacteriales bacterium]